MNAVTESEMTSEEEKAIRDKAIKQFEKGILLYYKHKNEQAINEFQKVIDEYNNIIDVACKARQYIQFCKE